MSIDYPSMLLLNFLPGLIKPLSTAGLKIPSICCGTPMPEPDSSGCIEIAPSCIYYAFVYFCILQYWDLYFLTSCGIPWHHLIGLFFGNPISTPKLTSNVSPGITIKLKHTPCSNKFLTVWSFTMWSRIKFVRWTSKSPTTLCLSKMGHNSYKSISQTLFLSKTLNIW